MFGKVKYLFLIFPFIVYTYINYKWFLQKELPITGDEPHYLILTDSILKDFDLDVKNNYELDDQTKHIKGNLDHHSIQKSGGGEFSLHNLGLPILLAIPYLIGKIVGSKAFLCLLTGLFPLLFYKLFFHFSQDTNLSIFLSLVNSLCLPYLFASNQIYPDLISGLLLVYLILPFATPKLRISIHSFSYAIFLALLPWLHIKNITVAAFFYPYLFYHRKDIQNKLYLVYSFGLISISLLLFYNFYAYDNLLGPYTEKAALFSFRNNLMILLGLHLDQRQGIFFHNPFLFFGIIGIPILYKRNLKLFIILCLAYFPILILNSVHHCWYGCWSFVGRFQWSLISLWIIPSVYFINTFSQYKIFFYSLGSICLFYQAFLFYNWYHKPYILLTDIVGKNNPYNELFPQGIKEFLPSFYSFNDYFFIPTNYVFVFFVIGLFVLGLRIYRKNL